MTDMHWPEGKFWVHDPEPDNHHSALYLVFPGGFMVNVSCDAREGVDIVRANWIAETLNAAMSVQGCTCHPNMSYAQPVEGPCEWCATASTTPETGAEKVATVVEDEGSREALNPLPNQHTRDRIAELENALIDALAGWRYIRQHHGDLYGVGWDRVEQAAVAALQAKGAE